MRKRINIGILIFFLALSARVLYLEEIKNTYLFYHPIVDSGSFEHSSARISEGSFGGENTRDLRRIPLYQNFLACIYKIGGRNLYLGRFIQSILGAFSCFLIYLIGLNTFDRRVGILAGIVASLYWPLIAFEAKFLPVNLAVFFSALTLAGILRFLTIKKTFWILLSGVFLALAVSSRANIGLFFPVFAVWLVVIGKKEKTFKKGILHALLFVIGFGLVIAPTITKFYHERKEVMPIQDNYGVGIYFGSDLELIRIKPGSSWLKLMMELLEKDLTEINERNIYFLKKTKDLILSNPLGYVDTLLKKNYVLWNYYEFSPRENINYFRKKSPFLSLPLFNFGSIAAFSILGMVLAWRRKSQKLMPLYLFVFTYEASLLLFMPLSRYRLPVAPFLIIFAAYSVNHLVDYFYKRQRSALFQYAALFVPLFILTNTNVIRGYLDDFSRPLYHEGLAYLRQTGDASAALTYLKKALMENPKDPDIYETIGTAYQSLGDLSKAESSYKKALKLESRFQGAINKLGVVYAKQGKYEEAKNLFEKAVSSFPVEPANAHINLGSLYQNHGDCQMAEKEYCRALFLEPDNLQALYRLGKLYDKTQNPKKDEIWKRFNAQLEKIK
ncbi:MAG: tetratricopeptide repeat protein [Candidatus Omnitrophica bacterium]|nr:tetratricopeptide repeat protein [Candidatus Omnitrophota bacterium]